MMNILSDLDTRQVNQIIAEEIGISEGEITAGAVIMDDLGADSLTVIEIGMAVEDHFHILIPDGEFERIRTVRDLHEALSGLLSASRVRTD